ncbi:MAG: hypothetical protein IJ257_06705 [Treponema sp.]|nr:hypothetical protein [Treponema sp.]
MNKTNFIKTVETDGVLSVEIQHEGKVNVVINGNEIPLSDDTSFDTIAEGDNLTEDFENEPDSCDDTLDSCDGSEDCADLGTIRLEGKL